MFDFDFDGLGLQIWWKGLNLILILILFFLFFLIFLDEFDYDLGKKGSGVTVVLRSIRNKLCFEIFTVNPHCGLF